MAYVSYSMINTHIKTNKKIQGKSWGTKPMMYLKIKMVIKANAKINMKKWAILRVSHGTFKVSL